MPSPRHSGSRGTGDISMGVCFIQRENDSHLPLWAQLCGDSICLKSPAQCLNPSTPGCNYICRQCSYRGDKVRMTSQGGSSFTRTNTRCTLLESSKHPHAKASEKHPVLTQTPYKGQAQDKSATTPSERNLRVKIM